MPKEISQADIDKWLPQLDDWFATFLEDPLAPLDLINTANRLKRMRAAREKAAADSNIIEQKGTP